MAVPDDLINFDLIEHQKENIQSLPQGRSAKALATAFAPSPFSPLPTPGSTRNLNDAIRQEYERELRGLGESDDPLDIFDRYVKWTMTAYPSAQATPDSQLRPLLERATKTFQSSGQYKNDVRYLKLWLSYIRFFADTPREAYAYLARHGIGEDLALFYEEFAAWLEGAGRWTQAEEIYRLGIDHEARPLERLMRKFGEFQQRRQQRSSDVDEPSSPALPTVRPALATKVDPFATATPPSSDPQAQRLSSSVAPARSGRAKIAIFADAEGSAADTPAGVSSARGWENLGSVADRRKENVMEARPWAGETLKAGKKVGTGTKLAIFKDPSQTQCSQEPPHPSSLQHKELREALNPRTGRLERIFIDLEAVYPNPDLSEEFSFEELRALHRGWLSKQWTRDPPAGKTYDNRVESAEPKQRDLRRPAAHADDTISGPIDAQASAEQGQESRHRRKKAMKPGGETQTIKLNMSPHRTKIRRKSIAEPTVTMTIHTRAATDDILDIFNQPLQHVGPIGAKADTDGESDFDEDDYTTTGDSTCASRVSGSTSEVGPGSSRGSTRGDDDFTEGPDADDDLTDGPVGTTEGADATIATNIPEDATELASGVHDYDPSAQLTDCDASQWSDFTRSKHVPTTVDDHAALEERSNDEVSLDGKARQSQAVDEQSAEQSELPDTNATTSEDAVDSYAMNSQDCTERDSTNNQAGYDEATHSLSRFVPIPPEDYQPSTLSYRDAAHLPPNRLPFMTPIVEKTESSLGFSSVQDKSGSTDFKTPCRPRADAARDLPNIDELDIQSPLQEVINDATPPRKLLQTTTASSPSRKAASPNAQPLHNPTRSSSLEQIDGPVTAGPIICDLQVSPVDEAIRQTILQQSKRPLANLAGFHDHQPLKFGHSAEIRKFIKALSKNSKSNAERTASLPPAPILKFDATDKRYVIRRELGRGAFAPVYLAEELSDQVDERTADDIVEKDLMESGLAASDRTSPSLVAIKAEDPPNPWEFYIMSTAHERLCSVNGGQSALVSHDASQASASAREALRACASLAIPHGLHLYADECYLLESFHSQGTLLDLVNLARSEAGSASNGAMGSNVSSGLLDESVVMFFVVELLRTMEQLHAVGILHGDLKADNCLVRLDKAYPSTLAPSPSSQSPGDLASAIDARSGDSIPSTYDPSGAHGWAGYGLSLIDFGRGIDLYAFAPDVAFIADWKADRTDCPAIREMRPWTYQADYWGLAGVVHVLLFGKWIEDVPDTRAVATVSTSESGGSKESGDTAPNGAATLNGASTGVGAGADSNHGNGSGTGASTSTRRVRLREPFKRYWATELWTALFDALLNPTSHVTNEANGRLPLRSTLPAIRARLEDWLVTHSARRGLRGFLQRVADHRARVGKS